MKDEVTKASRDKLYCYMSMIVIAVKHDRFKICLDFRGNEEI